MSQWLSNYFSLVVPTSCFLTIERCACVVIAAELALALHTINMGRK